MADQYDPFLPQHVEEEIEQLTANKQFKIPFRKESTDANARLVDDLQKHYNPEQKKYQRALQRVENRLLEHYAARDGLSASNTAEPSLQRTQQLTQWTTPRRRRERPMQENRVPISRLASFARSVSLVAIVFLLIGSIMLVLSYVHQRSTITGGETVPIRATPINPGKESTPTAIASRHLGETLYTTPANNFGFNGIAWSPDSKRVASSTINGVQIWDATDGQHLVSVQMPGANEYPTGIDWSPNSQIVAIATNQHVLLVNGESGQIVRTYTGNITAVTHPVSPGMYLSNQLPEGGGYGYRDPAWSPDGQQMASVYSYGATGIIQVWNPQTGATNFTLTASSSENIGTVSWSSDGQYIAATTWNTQATAADPTQTTNMIIVWQVSTHQMIFQHTDSLTSSDGVVRWQPRSHNLAFEGIFFSNNQLLETLEIWNGVTGNLVKRYIGVGTGSLDWSPDGRYLAYSDHKSNTAEVVVIRDMGTDKVVYTYTGHQNLHINEIVWSPNGKYIVSSEGNSQGNHVAKVWVAQ